MWKIWGESYGPLWILHFRSWFSATMEHHFNERVLRGTCHTSVCLLFHRRLVKLSHYSGTSTNGHLWTTITSPVTATFVNPLSDGLQYNKPLYSTTTLQRLVLCFHKSDCCRHSAGTWHLHKVASTSMQRHDVASTLRRLCVNVMCPLGSLHCIWWWAE